MDPDKSARRRALLKELAELEGAAAPIEELQNESFQHAVAGAPEFVLLVDDGLVVRFLNRMHEAGPDPVGTPLLTHVEERDHEVMVDAITRARRHGLARHCAVSAVGPDGWNVLYSVWVVPPARGGGEPLTMLICADLEHRVRIEQALLDERSVLRSLLDHTPDHVMVVDRERHVLFANRPVGGLTLDQLLAKPLEWFVHEAYRPRVTEAVEQVFSTAKSAALEVRVDLPESARWYETNFGPVLVEGKVDRVCVTSRDITERHVREAQRSREREALRESEERFRTLVEHAPEAVVILDPETGLFVEANSQASKMFGLSREELLQRGPAELSPERQPDGQRSEDASHRLVEAALSGRRLNVEWILQSADGETKACEVRLVPLPYGDRRLVRGSLIDISARKQAEAERIRLSEELFQARKLQAIGQLTGGVAHDFNNLLTVIMSQAEMLEIGETDSQTVHRRAEGILQACQRASTLTQSLLAFARRQPLRPRVVDPVDVVHNVAQLLHRTLGEKVELRIHEDAEHWACDVDPAQLENALLNLALNGRDAVPNGGRLDIRVNNLRMPSVATRDGETIREGEYVRLQVEDDGEGMSPDVLERACEPFFTTKEVGSGSGLGLSMVHGFVRQSNGHVELDSAPGRGTRVSIYLPRVEASHLAPAAAAEKPAAPRGQGQCVLVVEDEAQVRELTVSRLEFLGYRTLGAPDAAAGLALLDCHQVDLLLTDVVLPGGSNGVDLAKNARVMWPDLPVVFMSGYPQNALSDRDRIDRGLIFVQKPFTLTELAVSVQLALGATGSRDRARQQGEGEAT